MKAGLIKPAAKERARAVAIAERSTRTAFVQMALTASAAALILALLVTARF